MSKVMKNLNFYYCNYPIFKLYKALKLGLYIDDITKTQFFNNNDLNYLIYQQGNYLQYATLIMDNRNMHKSVLYPKDVDLLFNSFFCK